MEEESYIYLKRKILQLTDINLDDYKSQQMKRRLGNFIDYSGEKSVIDYCHLIEEDPKALRKLLDFLTINVSEFFRDTHIFEKLHLMVIPELLKQTRFLHIWSAGCSRGQEPYSITMMMDTYFPSVKYRLLATDIDDGALGIARAGGPYTQEDVRHLPDLLRDKYLEKVDGRFFIKDQNLKRKIEFKKQNLLNETFAEGFHLIVCRNVTIYFTEQAKRELNTRFHKSLVSNGILFIGGTEVMLDAPQLGFKSVGICLYQKMERAAEPNLFSHSHKIPAKL